MLTRIVGLCGIRFLRRLLVQFFGGGLAVGLLMIIAGWPVIGRIVLVLVDLNPFSIQSLTRQSLGLVTIAEDVVLANLIVVKLSHCTSSAGLSCCHDEILPFGKWVCVARLKLLLIDTMGISSNLSYMGITTGECNSGQGFARHSKHIRAGLHGIAEHWRKSQWRIRALLVSALLDCGFQYRTLRPGVTSRSATTLSRVPASVRSTVLAARA